MDVVLQFLKRFCPGDGKRRQKLVGIICVGFVVIVCYSYVIHGLNRIKYHSVEGETRTVQVFDDIKTIFVNNKTLCTGSLPTWRQRIRRYYILNSIKNAQVMNNVSFFKPKLSPIQHARLVNMLQTFLTVCDSVGIPYTLGFGSLLGSVRHFGMNPWDDDVDVVIHEKFKMKLSSTLYVLQTQGYTLNTSRRKLWRVRPLRKGPGCVDVFLYEEQGPYINYYGRSFLKKHMFPVKYFPFEDMVLPVPNRYDIVLNTLYGDWRTYCSYQISHKAQTAHVIPCSRLYDVYPFVLYNRSFSFSRVDGTLRFPGHSLKQIQNIQNLKPNSCEESKMLGRINL